MSKAIMAIPRAGENLFYKSVTEAADTLKVKTHVINNAIESGNEVLIGGKYYCFDYAIDLPEEESEKKKETYPLKYELTSVKTDRIYKFRSYIEMAKFGGRSNSYALGLIEKQKELFVDKDGDVYKFRVIA